MDLAEQLMEDIADFKAKHGLTRLVMVWCASTEIFLKPRPRSTQTLAAFEKGLRDERPGHRPIDGLRLRRHQERRPLRQRRPEPHRATSRRWSSWRASSSVPICGKDFKTGQTLMKTILAPGFKSRLLGVNGWFSTNILGNRDGEVLDDPESFKTKEESKLSVLDSILQPHLYPELYGNLYHKVRINYYPPRGDNKEAWDNIDIFGWLGYPMQIKINFLCRDSILAAPIVLDLALFLDLAGARRDAAGSRSGSRSTSRARSTRRGSIPEHDLFIQLMKLKNTLRWMKGEELITHLGIEYYD